MKFRKAQTKVFTPSKEHKKTRRTILFIEVLVVILIVIGTLAIFLRPQDLSWDRFIRDLERRVVLKNPETEIQNESFEEKIKALIDGKLLHIKSIKKSSQGFYTIESKEQTKVIIDEKKDLDDQVRTLQTVLSKAKIEKKRTILIDFRFEKLVVRFGL